MVNAGLVAFFTGSANNIGLNAILFTETLVIFFTLIFVVIIAYSIPGDEDTKKKAILPVFLFLLIFDWLMNALDLPVIAVPIILILLYEYHIMRGGKS